MPVLDPSEYDASYFDGRDQTVRHNAGYGRYGRWRRWDGPESVGEYWLDYAKTLSDRYSLVGKKTLEVGCAKGFLVEDMRSFGVDAWGLDVSAYAIGQAAPSVAPFLTVADARTGLVAYSNKEFDVLFSLRFFECIADADVPDLISEMRRISKKQFHQIGEQENASFYNLKTLGEWLTYDWAKGTILISTQDENKTLTK